MMTRQRAKAGFWERDGVFMSMFHSMKHSVEAVKILDNGTVLDEFIDEIYDDFKLELEKAKMQGFREAVKEMNKIK